MRKNLKLKLFLLTFLYNSPLFSMYVPDLGEPEPTPKSKSLNKPAKNLQDKATLKKLLKFHLESKDRAFKGLIEKPEDLEKVILKIKKSLLDQHIFLLRVSSNAVGSEREKANYLAGIQVSKNKEEYLIHYIDPTGASIPQKINSLFQENFTHEFEEPFKANRIQISGQTEEDQAIFLTYLFKLLKKNKPCPEIQNLPKFTECLRSIYHLELQIPKLTYKPKPNDIKNLAVKFAELGQLYIELGDATKDVSSYNEAALFYNYFISMTKGHGSLTKTINPYSMLNSIQSKIVEAIGGHQKELRQIITPDDHMRISRQDDLTEIRANVKSRLKTIKKQEDSVEASRQLFQEITSGMKTYLANLYKDAEKVLGKAPCDHAIIGLGSMVLQQMTPYSDLEFAILVSDETHENYFKKLTELVHFWVINLGETVIPKDKYGCDTSHLVRQGVNFDLGGKTPLGRFEGFKPYKLTCTVDQMLWYMRNDDQKSEHIDKNLPYILQKACLVHGNQDLFDKYNRAVTEFLKDHGESRAVKVLRDGCCEIDYATYSRKESKMLGNIDQFGCKVMETTGNIFNIKEDIYRLPDRFIYNLGLIYGIDAENSWGTLTQLAARGIINETAAMNLKKALTFATLLRLRAYSYYGYQKEEMDWKKGDGASLTQEAQENLIGQPFKLDTNDLEENGALYRYYYAALSLMVKLRDFCALPEQQKSEKSVFFKEELFDLSGNIAIKALIHKRLSKTNDYVQCMEQSLSDLKASHKEDIMLRRRFCYELAEGYKCLRDYEKAIMYYKEALKTNSSAEHSCNILNCLGGVWAETGEYQKSYESYWESLKKQKGSNLFIKGKPNEVVIATYNGLALSLAGLQNLEASLKYLEKGINLKEKMLAKDDPSWMAIYHNYGEILVQAGKRTKALPYFEKGLELLKKFYSQDSDQIAAAYRNIGACHKEHNPGEALKNYRKALKVLRKNPEIFCSHILEVCQQIAFVTGYRGLEWSLAGESLRYAEKSLSLCEKMFGKDDPSSASFYHTYGKILMYADEKIKALSYLKQALKLYKRPYNQNSFHVIEAYQDIGVCYEAYKPDKALKKYQAAFKIWKSDPEIACQDILTTCLKISLVYSNRKDYQDVLTHFSEVLEIAKERLDASRKVCSSIYYDLMANLFMELKYQSKAEFLEKVSKKIQNNEECFCAQKWGKIDDKTANITVAISVDLDWISKNTHEGYQEIHPRIVALCKDKDQTEQGIIKTLCFEAICLGVAASKPEDTAPLLCLKQFCQGNIELVKKIAEIHPEFFVKKEIVNKCIKDFPQELKELGFLLQLPKLTVQVEKPAITPLQQKLKKPALADQSFVGKGKAEIGAVPIMKQSHNSPPGEVENALNDGEPINSYQMKKDQYDQERLQRHIALAEIEKEQGNDSLSLYHQTEASSLLDEQDDRHFAREIESGSHNDSVKLKKPTNADQEETVSFLREKKLERVITNFEEIPQMKEDALRVVSYNITADFFDKNDTTEDQHHHWHYRAPFAKKLLESASPDVMCLQELSPNQAIELDNYFKDFGYTCAFLSQTPSDIETGALAYGEQVKDWQGKFCGTPLIGTFISKAWKFVKAGRFWLNEAPDAIPQNTDRTETDKGFGNMNTYRAVLWTKIEKENDPQKSLFVFNSHYPLSGDSNTRFKCAQLEMGKIGEIAGKDQWVSAGDRNIIPTKNDDNFNNPEIVYQELIKFGCDSRDAQEHYGVSTSWLGFSYDKYKNDINTSTWDFKDNSMLDVMVSNLLPQLSFCHHGAIDSKNKKILSLSEKLTEEQDTGRYFSSDHALIGGDFILLKNNF